MGERVGPSDETQDLPGKGGSTSSSSDSSGPDAAPGADFGAYHVQELIGSGGFGDVFLAVHRVLRRRAALKLIRPELAAKPNSVELFLREAQIVARFHHPNVVEIYDAGRGEGGRLFMAMRFVPGGSLHRLIAREGALPEAKALPVMRDCCAGLSAVHDLGLAHRDIKPANVLIEADGRACITDLGLACFREERVPGLDKEGKVTGTPLYMAPEQLTGQEPASQRSDLYSLGVTFTALLTGEAPYASLPLEEIVRRVVRGRLPDPKAARPDIGEGVASLLRKLTAQDPAERPRDAREVLTRVETLMASAGCAGGYRAPSGRADASAVREAGARIGKEPLAKVLLDAYPGTALVLNSYRQIVLANEAAVRLLGGGSAEGILGRRPGEALGCEEARRGHGGCGTAPSCRFCGLGRTLAEVERGRPAPVDGECTIGTGRGPARDFAFRLSRIAIAGGAFTLVALHDIGAEKRRRLLESTLVNNLLETAAAVRSLARTSARHEGTRVSGPLERRMSAALSRAGRTLVEEAVFHQHLLAAEAGELQALPGDVELRRLLAEACDGVRVHPLAEGRRLILRCPEDLVVRTDHLLLECSVRILLRAAVKSCPRDETVIVEAMPVDVGGADIGIHHRGVVTAEAREKMLKAALPDGTAGRGGAGAGVARLFVEGYLGGTVGFTSRASRGTTFSVRLPARPFA